MQKSWLFIWESGWILSLGASLVFISSTLQGSCCATPRLILLELHITEKRWWYDLKWMALEPKMHVFLLKRLMYDDKLGKKEKKKLYLWAKAAWWAPVACSRHAQSHANTHACMRTGTCAWTHVPKVHIPLQNHKHKSMDNNNEANSDLRSILRRATVAGCLFPCCADGQTEDYISPRNTAVTNVDFLLTSC